MCLKNQVKSLHSYHSFTVRQYTTYNYSLRAFNPDFKRYSRSSMFKTDEFLKNLILKLQFQHCNSEPRDANKSRLCCQRFVRANKALWNNVVRVWQALFLHIWPLRYNASKTQKKVQSDLNIQLNEAKYLVPRFSLNTYIHPAWFSPFKNSITIKTKLKTKIKMHYENIILKHGLKRDSAVTRSVCNNSLWVNIGK